MIWTFYKAWFKNPRAIGSVIPSSQFLARKIAQHVPTETPGLVVELGPGTGVITRAMLRRGIPHHRIVLIENVEDLVKHLRGQFPQVEVIHGNAAHLTELLKEKRASVHTIVSSLPLFSLPDVECERIMAEIEKILPPESYFIQYTYWFRKTPIRLKKRFKQIASERIWLNIPPAIIDVFKIT